MTSDGHLVNKKAQRKIFIRNNRAGVATTAQQFVTSKVECSFCMASLRYKTYARRKYETSLKHLAGRKCDKCWT